MSEVSSKDMSVVGTKQSDASDEEESELVVDEDQKDMREFLQSEEGAKWLQDNPDKKVFIHTWQAADLDQIPLEQPCSFHHSLPLMHCTHTYIHTRRHICM